ncbi:YciI family protein [Mesorhizobium sp. NBSH29]|uniref:YciI family protein n=1 Tax=Mesorhizobium sp. NBSH29 TaxID=2654249 RepID=UPI0018967358|nr:YciI family protein [Mesorhizobium sp. NBSH29]QPC86917.1 YciI family protein [Mesorhizobium sp. NBSH29]
MKYVILCYDEQAVTQALSPEDDAAMMSRLFAVQKKMADKGKLGPVAKLKPTNTARTLPKGAGAMVVDGPFAETKEQLLGFYLVDCEDEDEAFEFVRELSAAKTHGTGSYEVRPIELFLPAPPAA